MSEVVYQYESGENGVVMQGSAPSEVVYLVYPPGGGDAVSKTNKDEALALAKRLWDEYQEERYPTPKPPGF